MKPPFFFLGVSSVVSASLLMVNPVYVVMVNQA